MKPEPGFAWPKDKVRVMYRRMKNGESARDIAPDFGTTRSAVIGAVWRYKKTLPGYHKRLSRRKELLG